MGRYQKSATRVGESLQIGLEIGLRELQTMIEQGLRGLALEIGLEVAEALIGDEVERRCGRRQQRSHQEREGYRHGSQAGYIRVAGHRVTIRKPRVRTRDGREVELESYRQLQRENGDGAVLRRVVRGVSCRDYKAVVDAIRQGRGISASAVSRSFVQASAERVRLLAERCFHGQRFVAVLIDGVVFARETIVVALGVAQTGEKHILALRHGATENASVCGDLLRDLRERGVAAEQPILFVIDGSKSLHKAIQQVWGSAAFIQRCQVHKLRNVKGYVPDKHWPEFKTLIQAAYREPSFLQAKRKLEAIARRLGMLNPHAAASLRDGLDETLTVARLGLSGKLRRSLSSTNMIESIFSRTRMMTSRVKRWRAGNMRQRWCATALLHAEQGFHRVYGHADLGALLRRLDELATDVRKSA